MDQYEKSIREKVHAANILTPGEWVYLDSLFQMAREADEIGICIKCGKPAIGTCEATSSIYHQVR